MEVVVVLQHRHVSFSVKDGKDLTIVIKIGKIRVFNFVEGKRNH